MHQVTGQFVGRRRLASSPEPGTEARRTSAAITNQQTAVYLLANLSRSRSTNLIAGNPFLSIGNAQAKADDAAVKAPCRAADRADLGVVRSRRWCDLCYFCKRGESDAAGD
jgi:hypothetical protein